MAQARKRVYAFSIYDPQNKNVDWNGKWIRDDFSNELINQYINEYKPKYKHGLKKVLDLKNKNIEESKWSQIKDTPSRLRMIEFGDNLNKKGLVKTSTVTTKQDRFPNVGRIKFEYSRKDDDGTPYTNYRFISPMEAYMLMGFNKKYYKRAKNDMLKTTMLFNARTNSNAREKLYKQAGNSIAINVLEEIFYYARRYNK